jgi:N utilization substance protein A
MPVVVRSEFALALNQVCTERGIDAEVVLETIKAAILAAYRKDFGEEDIEKLEVQLDASSGEAKILKEGKDITPPGFGRIAAQTAKQVILQRIREAEKAAILSDYSSRIGTIVNGMVLRFDGSNIIVDIGRAEGVMPPSEQVKGEDYRINQRLTFYIEGIREGARGSEIIVSRAHKGLVEGLFHREIPEVASKAVQIKALAREAGSRTKVAVFSSQPGVDPVGSCVGQKGVRVQAVIAELGGMEKLDIVQWNEDAALFIASSLAPAKGINVILDQDKQVATAVVPDDQLSLAIGRDGQNVRLAVKLTGWKINIKGKTEFEKATKATAAKKTKKVSRTKKTSKKRKTTKIGKEKKTA